jgi:peptide methionine sulfoxide reductase msrA/msrB
MESARKSIIYFAGGCFWGIEKLMGSVPGVAGAVSGYANGHTPNPTYDQVCTGQTGHMETVRVAYDPQRVSLEALVFLFFSAIDTGVQNRQGNDVGTQYQTGIFYENPEDRARIERAAQIERGRRDAFFVRIEPLTAFYEAEEHHQDYLNKHPGGYCHLPVAAFARARSLVVDPEGYLRPQDDVLRARLTPMEYSVTQQDATEHPFEGAYWDSNQKGLYVDAATGEPLFSSKDKYSSDCGWPAFARSIDENAMVYRRDHAHGMVRTEVRSRAGDSHLGHVFDGDRQSPSGVRYCINSAALRFVPYEKMDERGYGHLKRCID